MNVLIVPSEPPVTLLYVNGTYSKYFRTSQAALEYLTKYSQYFVKENTTVVWLVTIVEGVHNELEFIRVDGWNIHTGLVTPLKEDSRGEVVFRVNTDWAGVRKQIISDNNGNPTHF